MAQGYLLHRPMSRARLLDVLAGTSYAPASSTLHDV
jgi:hypothetical protein